MVGVNKNQANELPPAEPTGLFPHGEQEKDPPLIILKKAVAEFSS